MRDADFVQCRSAAGRNLQRMLQSRSDIRRLIGFAETAVLEEVLACLDDRHDFAAALHEISNDWRKSPDASRIASDALGKAAGRRWDQRQSADLNQSGT